MKFQIQDSPRNCEAISGTESRKSSGFLGARLKIQKPKSSIFNFQSSIKNNGFTLMELLVVIAIMGILAGIMLPTINKARERANRAVCAGNLKVIGEAFNMYNIDIGEMPPIDPPNNVATNQIGKAGTPIIPIGMGYFHEKYIEDFAVFACPSSDYILGSKPIKSDWDAGNPTYTTYIYRAGSGYDIGKATLMLGDSKPAIVLDYNDIRVRPKYNHQGEYVNILFRNGYVKGIQNANYSGVLGPNGQLTLSGAVDEDNLFRHMTTPPIVDGGADSYQ